MDQKLIMTNLSPQELGELIQNCIDKALQDYGIGHEPERKIIKYLNQKEMAAHLGVSVSTLARARQTGRQDIPEPVKVGRRLLYPVYNESDKPVAGERRVN